jgi:hypothetical protein
MAIIEINKAQSDADYAKIGELAKELSNVAPLGTITSHHPRFLDNYFYILNYTAAQLACDAAYQASKESFPKSSTDISKQGLLAGTLANKADGHRMKIQLEQSPEFVQTVVRSRALSGNAKSAATYLSDYYAKKAGAGDIDDPTISDYRFWYDAAKIYALCRSNVDYSRSMDCLLIAHRLGLSQDEKRIENVKICPELKPVRDSKTASVVRRQSGFFIYNTVATSTSAAFRELFP